MPRSALTHTTGAGEEIQLFRARKRLRKPVAGSIGMYRYQMSLLLPMKVIQCLSSLTDRARAPMLNRLAVVAWWRAFLVHLVVREVLRSFQHQSLARAGLALAFGVALALSLRVQEIKHSAIVAVATAITKFVAIFPDNSNHSYIELVVVCSVAIVDVAHATQRASLIAFVRVLPTVVFFQSGIQKILHGTYFDGAYLASKMNEERFRHAFALILKPEELSRLVARAESGSTGPFEFSSPSALALSNGVYVGELAVALLLLFRRTRRVGVLAAISLCLAIELAAREVMFGLLMLLLIISHGESRSVRRGAFLVVALELLVLGGYVALGSDLRTFN